MKYVENFALSFTFPTCVKSEFLSSEKAGECCTLWQGLAIGPTSPLHGRSTLKVTAWRLVPSVVAGTWTHNGHRI